MISLRELQREFMHALFEPDPGAIASRIVGGAPGVEHRLARYRNNTFTNMRNAMQSAFPVIRRLLGDGCFHFAATEYIRRHPSESGDLHAYGDAFDGFLRTYPPTAALPYLPDTARLEWACHTAYFAADHAPLELSRLAAVPADHYGRLLFRLHPSCRLLASEFPVDRIWQVNQEGYDGDDHVALSSGNVWLLIRRPRFHAEVLPLQAGEWQLLRSLADNEPLAEAVAQALNVAPDLDPGPVLRRFVAEGTVVDFDVR